jgi:hypothetical protein
MKMMTGQRPSAEGERRKVVIPAHRHAEGGAARVVVERREDGRVALLVANAAERAGCILGRAAAEQVADAATHVGDDQAVPRAVPAGLPVVRPGRGPRRLNGRAVMPSELHAAWCGFQHALPEPLTQLAQLADCAGCGVLVEYRATPGGAA